MTPTARTLNWLRKEGWNADVVERYNAFVRRRFDLFGGLDIVAVRDRETLGVQCTTVDNQAARLAKLADLPGIQAWLKAGNLCWVVGWSKRGARGKRKLWTPSVTELLADGV